MPAVCRLMSWILVLAALALAMPAATLAAGGSAGDQQYTDPFAGTPNPGGTQSTTHATTTTPVPATTPATAPATTTPPADSTPAPAPATPAPAASTDSAPAAATPTATTARPTTLPFTGYDSWLAGGVGAALIAGGLLLRRRLHPD